MQLAYQIQRGAKQRRIKDFVRRSSTGTVEGVENVESRFSTSGLTQKLAGYDLIAAETRAEERSLLAVIRQSSCFVVQWFVKGLQ